MSTESGTLHVLLTELDRNAVVRDDANILETLREDPATRVVVVRDDETLVTGTGTLALRSPFHIAGEATWGYLGHAGGLHYIVAVPEPETTVDEVGGEFRSLRTVGGTVAGLEAELLVESVALARWFRDANFCSFCGGSAVLKQAGWSRTCTVCEREHFPRTDPAIIVAITDGDRVLLGSNAMWQQNRYSCFAGFVEAGESLEGAVHREMAEEAGVAVTNVTYAGSQPWPYPRSLMLGFYAHVDADQVPEPDGTEILEVRWFTKADVRAAYAGETDVLLPGNASIAHALLSTWAHS